MDSVHSIGIYCNWCCCHIARRHLRGYMFCTEMTGTTAVENESEKMEESESSTSRVDEPMVEDGQLPLLSGDVAEEVNKNDRKTEYKDLKRMLEHRDLFTVYEIFVQAYKEAKLIW